MCYVAKLFGKPGSTVSRIVPMFVVWVALLVQMHYLDIYIHAYIHTYTVHRMYVYFT